MKLTFTIFKKYICTSSFGNIAFKDKRGVLINTGRFQDTEQASLLSRGWCNLRVLLVDEICDSGRTLASLKLLISQRNAASVKTCVLLDKVSRRQADIRPDYVGAVCPDEFVVGYGMDWGGKLRSLPFVGVVRRELYES